ncbi:FAD-binding oxidoreductase [Paenibacillus allorhizosphaerae]|uniref:FAD-linked oxidoreductase YvdP n=1 Tax=Paenibacillus allorhizosphaerae TaxID=2849866 RepID=A0ABM8VDV1_9BACL|nr:FAD-binding oxidoreductase [Paenibacillus allorhizosphaerae]CAG7628993.1 putative FAD-linked oxidoreductase YvdP [Paenibacillus allorhizosphaerae]
MTANTEGLTGRVVTEHLPEYAEASRSFNARFHKRPLLIVYCQVTEDVANAIRWAKRYRIPFRVRCGGHSYEAYSTIDGGLVIDISELQQLTVNLRAGTAKLGAGFRLLPLYEALWKYGVAIPGGTCPSVGISGLTLGGGFGLLSRQFGMTCDNVIELEMVNARGVVIRANEWQHRELFWACRGAGDGSFGVITSFTFRVHPIRDVAYYTMKWDFADLPRVVRSWQQWAPQADPRLTALLNMSAPKQGGILSVGVFIGTEQELRARLAPLQTQVPPQSLTVRAATWLETARHFAGQPVRQQVFKNSSAYVYEPLPDSAIDTLKNQLAQAPDGSDNMVSMDAYGGAIGRLPNDATAFVHRQALFVMQYQSYWYRLADASKNIRWVERIRQAMLPYTRGAYRDYCDAMIPDWQDAYFGENVERLKRVKRLYDPENLFRFEQSIRET